MSRPQTTSSRFSLSHRIASSFFAFVLAFSLIPIQGASTAAATSQQTASSQAQAVDSADTSGAASATGVAGDADASAQTSLLAEAAGQAEAAEGATVESELVSGVASSAAGDAFDAQAADAVASADLDEAVTDEPHPLAYAQGQDVPLWAAHIASSAQARELPATVQAILESEQMRAQQQLADHDVVLSQAHLADGATRVPQDGEVALLSFDADAYQQAVKAKGVYIDEASKDTVANVIPSESEGSSQLQALLPTFEEVAADANRTAVVEAVVKPSADAADAQDQQTGEALTPQQQLDQMTDEQHEALTKRLDKMASAAQTVLQAAFATDATLDALDAQSWLAVQQAADADAVPYVLLAVWDHDAQAASKPIVCVALPATDAALLAYIYVSEFTGKAPRVEAQADYLAPEEDAQETDDTDEDAATDDTDEDVIPSEARDLPSDDQDAGAADTDADADEDVIPSEERDLPSSDQETEPIPTLNQLLSADTPVLKAVGRIAAMQLKAARSTDNATFNVDVPASYQADGSQVETFTLTWIPKDSTQAVSDNTITVTPANASDADIYLTAQLDYALSGEFDYAPGDVRITIPTTIFTNRDGTKGDIMVIPFPQAPSTANDFNWTLSTDKNGNPVYVLTNTHTISAATKGWIQFGFSKITPHKVVDMKTSDPFQAVIEVTTHAGNIIGRNTDMLTARIDTQQTLTRVTKQASGGYPSKDDESLSTLRISDLIMSKSDFTAKYGNPVDLGLPDVDEYVVVDWATRMYHEGNTEFSISVNDTIPNKFQGRVVRLEVSNQSHTGTGNLTLTANDVFSGWESNGNMYCLATTAYPLTDTNFPPNSNYDDGKYWHTLENTVTFTLTQKDNGTTQTKSATAKAQFHRTAPKKTTPQGHYNLFKWGNDGDDTEHMSGDVAKYGNYGVHRQWTVGNETTSSFSPTGFYNGYYENWYGIYHDALNRLSGVNEGTDPEDVQITYTIEHDAYLMPWTYITGSNPYTKSDAETNADYYTLRNFGVQPVTSVITDTGLTMKGTKLAALDDYTFTALYIPRPLVGYAKATNLSSTGALISNALDGTFVYNAATDYSSIANYEADGTTVARDLGAAEPIYVDIQVRNADGTTSWINNYASLDYSTYKKMKKTSANAQEYAENEKANIVYFYNTDGTPKYDIMPWDPIPSAGDDEEDDGEGEGAGSSSDPVERPTYTSVRGTTLTELPANMVNFRTHVTTNKAYWHYYVLPTVKLKASYEQEVPAAGDGDDEGEGGEGQGGTTTQTVVTRPTTIATNAFGTGSTKTNYAEVDVVNGVTMQAYSGSHYPGDGSGASAGSTVFTKTVDGTDKLRGYRTDTQAVPSKTGEFIGQDNRSVYLHYTAQMEFKSFIQDLDTYNKEVEQKHIPQVTEGVFYDLLPAGVTPDLSSVKLRDGDAITSVYTIPNYRQSGRTMMVVKASLTPSPQKYQPAGDSTSYYEDVPSIEFDAIYDVGSLVDHGDTPHNVIAFQATKTNGAKHDGKLCLGTVDGYRGEYDTPALADANNFVTQVTTGDNPTTISPNERTWLTDLDNDDQSGAASGEDPLFLYAGTNTAISGVTAGQTGLSKNVSTNGDGVWTTGKDEGDVRLVYEDGYYAYRLRVASSQDTITSGIVLYDTLESFIPGQFGGTDEKGNQLNDLYTPQWHGTLQSVDVAQMSEVGEPEKSGVAAVVYYSVLKAGQTSGSDDSITIAAAKDEEGNTTTPATTISGSDIANGYDQNGVHTDPGTAPTLAKYYEGDNTTIQSQYALLKDDGSINSSVWMTEAQLKAKGYTLADATMIAIDARKDKNGNDYKLEPGKSLVAYVYMHAPAEASPYATDYANQNSRYYIANNAHAFNNVYLFSYETNVETGVTGSAKSVRFDYTKVGLKEMKVPVQKVWDDDNDRDGFRPTETGVRMYLHQTDVETNVTEENIRAIDVVEGGYYVVDPKTGNRTGDLVTRYRDDETGVEHDLTDRWPDGWVGIFTGIPATNANGVPYAYSVTEEPVTFDNTSTYGEDGDKGQYTLSMGADGEGGYAANNRHEPIRVNIEGEKTWLGDTDEELATIYGSNDTHSQVTVRPSYVDVDLYKTVEASDGTATTKRETGKRVRPSVDGTWSYAFDNLYKYENNGKMIAWTLQERSVFDTYIPFQYNTADEVAWMDELEDAQAIARAIYRGYFIDSEGVRREVASNPNGRYFINVYHPFGDVVLSKTVQNATKAAEDAEFTFEVTLQQEAQDGSATVLQPLDGTYEYGVFTLNDQGSPQPVMDPANPEKQLGGTVASGGAITLKDGQFARVYDLPDGTHYSFTERTTAGFTATGGETKEGIVEPNEPVQPFQTAANSVAYTNVYRSEGSTSLGVNKSLVGRPQQNHYQFTFFLTQLHVNSDGTPSDAETRLVRSAKTITLPEKNEADTNNATYASATFSGLVYSSETAPADVEEGWATHKVVNGKDAWTYVYEITESIPAAATATFTIDEDGEEKEVELTYEDAQQSEHITAAQLASASWKLNGYTYDTSRIRVEVTVTDQGDGTMTTREAYTRYNPETGTWDAVAAPDAMPAAPVRADYATGEAYDDAVANYYSGGRTFANSYEAKGQWNPQAYKRLPGRVLQAEQFGFTLQPLGPSREPLADAAVYTATNEANGAVNFDTINYTLESILADQRAGKNTFTSYTDEATGTTTNYWIYYYAVTETIPEDATATIGGTTYTYAEAQENDSITADQVAAATWQKGDYLYDTSTYYYAVRITDRGNGKLNVVAGYVDKDGNTSTTSPIFVNELGPGNLSVTKTVADSSGDANKEFKFHVRLMGDEDKINALSPITWKVSDASTESSESDENNTGSENGDQADGNQQNGTNSTAQPASAPRRAPSTATETPIATYYCNSFVKAVTVSTDEYYNGTKRNMAIDLYADGRMVVRPYKENTYAVGSSANFKHILDEIANDFAEYDTYFSKIDLEFAEGIAPAGSDAMKGMFSGCSTIRSIDLSHFTGTSKLTDLTEAFSDCTSLETLDLSGVTMVDARANIITSKAFSNCLALSSITFGSSFSFQTNANQTNRLPDYNWKLDNGDGTYSQAISSSDLATLYGTGLQGTWVRVSPEYNIRFYEDSSDSAFYGNRYTEVSVPIADSYTIDAPLELLSKEEYATKEFVGWMMAYTGSPLGQAQLIDHIFGKPDRFTTLTRSIDPIPPYNADDKYFLVVPGTVLGPIDPKWWTMGTENGKTPLKLAAVWQDRSATITDGEFEFTLRPGQTATFEGLPAGTSYQVWEETEDGWELVETSGDHGTIEPETTKNASFKNLYTPGKVSAQFSGTKTFDGQAPAAGRYSFQVVPVSTTASGLSKATMPMPGETAEEGSAERLALTGTGDDRVYTVANGESGFVQFPSISFEADGEYVYEITEVVPNENDATYEAATSYDGSTWTVTVNVTDNGDGTKSSTVTYNRNGSAVDKSSFKFENTSIPARLLLGKTVTEGSLTPANEDAEFTFKLRFLNEDGVPVANGTSFDWYYADADGNPINPDSDDSNDPDDDIDYPSDNDEGWKPYANIKWMVDDNGTLWIKPADGTSATLDISGTMPWTNNKSVEVVRVIPNTTIRLEGSRPNASTSVTTGTSLFAGCENLREFYGSGFDTSALTNMASLFKGLTGLEKADLSSWEVSRVSDFSRMFNGCTSLTSVDTTGWNTSAAQYMNGMFNGCVALTSVAGVSTWNTDKVTTTQQMFMNCNSLPSIDISGWDMSKNNNTTQMFQNNNNLASITLGTKSRVSSSDTSSAMRLDRKGGADVEGAHWTLKGGDGTKYTAAQIFALPSASRAGTWIWVSDSTSGAALIKAPVFKKLGEALVGAGADALAAGAAVILSAAKDLPSFGQNSTNEPGDSSGSSTLQNDDWTIGGFLEGALDTLMGVQPAYAETITGKAYDDGGTGEAATWTFDTDTGALVISNGKLSSGASQKLKDFAGLSSYWDSIKSVSFDNCIACSKMDQFFYSGYNVPNNIEAISLKGLDTSSVTSMKNMFYNCFNLASIDLSGLDTRGVTDMESMFNGCSKLTSLDLKGFDTSSVTDMWRMFSGCSKLTSLDLSRFDTGNVTDMSGMFNGCSNLTSLDLSGFDTGNVTDMVEMFSGCSNLTSLNLSGLNTSSVTQMNGMFNRCSKLTSLDLSSFNTSQVTTIQNMFCDCWQLSKLDLSSFDTSSLTNMSNFIDRTFSLTYLDVRNFNTAKVTPGSNASYVCFSQYTACPTTVVLGPGWFENSKTAWFMLPEEISVAAGNSNKVAGSWAKIGSDGSTVMAKTPSEMTSLSEAELAGTWTFVPNDSTKSFLSYHPEGGVITLGNTTGGEHTVYAYVGTGASVTLKTPTRAGYIFLGWYENPEYTGTRYKAGEAYTLTKSANHLYARWLSQDQAIKVTTNHYKQRSDGTYGNTPDATDVEYFDPADIAATVDPLTSFTPAVRSAYASQGYVLPDTQTIKFDGSTSYNVTYKYQLAPYTVAYDANGGTGSMESSAVKAGRSYSVLANGFAKQGSVFTGWNTKADGSGQAYIPGDRIGASAFDSVGAGGTLTLYAQWIENKNGPLTTAGGEVTVKLKPGQRIVFPKLPAGTTYEIVETDLPNGWSIDKATGEIVSGTTVTGTANAADEDEATFTNSYEAAGSVAVQAHKLLEGATAQDGQFTFEIADPTTAGSALSTTNRAQDGDSGTAPILFPDISFTLSGIAADVAAGRAAPVVQLSQADAAKVDAADVLAQTTVQRTVQGSDGDEGDGGTGVQTVTDTLTYVAWKADMAGYEHPSAWLYETTLGEIAGSDEAIIYDNATHKVKVLVADAGNGRLVATVLPESVEGATDRSNTDSKVTFKNEMKDGSLRLAKTLVNATPAAQEAGTFTFAITLVDEAGNPVTGTYDAYLVAEAEGEGSAITEPYGATGKLDFDAEGAQVQLKGGQTVLVEGLPHGATYTITERAADGFTQTEATNAEGTISAPNTSGVSVQNTYSTRGSAQIEVYKTLHSANAIAQGQFTFLLLDEDNEVMARATNGAATQESLEDDDEFASSAPVNFGEVVFTLEDLLDGSGNLQNSITRTYYVVEENDSQENITYDDALYRIEITFTDNGQGEMTSSVVYYDVQGNQLQPAQEGGETPVPEFLNKFTLKMPESGQAGIAGAAALLAALLGSLALMLARARRRQQQGATAITGAAAASRFSGLTSLPLMRKHALRALTALGVAMVLLCGTLTVAFADDASSAGSSNQKKTVPTVQKEALDLTSGDWSNAVSLGVGKPITYRATGTLPSDLHVYEAYTYWFLDTPGPGLQIDEGSIKAHVLHADGTTSDIDLDIVPDGNTLRMGSDDIMAILPTLAHTDQIIVDYTAHVTPQALRAGQVENTIELEYTNNPDTENSGRTVPGVVYVFSFGLDILKVEAGTSTPLPGAQFTLQDADGRYFSADDTWKDASDDTCVFATAANGHLQLTGLDAGTYTLTEVAAPAGYQPLAQPLTVQIAPTKVETNGAVSSFTATVKGPGATVTNADTTTLMASITVEDPAITDGENPPTPQKTPTTPASPTPSASTPAPQSVQSNNPVTNIVRGLMAKTGDSAFAAIVAVLASLLAGGVLFFAYSRIRRKQSSSGGKPGG